MFAESTALIDASGLDLTDIKLTDGCYFSMFQHCTSLMAMPKLLAMTITSECYSYMFSGCNSLIGRCDLPATSIEGRCYDGIFNGCTKISEIHFPKSMKTNVLFNDMTDSPKFGATIDDDKIFYDL